LDYLVSKMPRFPFDKFSEASNELGMQMKATGEVMGIGANLEECLLKAFRSLENGACHVYKKKFDKWPVGQLLSYIEKPTDDRIYAIAQLIYHKTDIEQIYKRTMIDKFFLNMISKIIDMENKIEKAEKLDKELILEAKKMGFSDKYIAILRKCTPDDIYELREKMDIRPAYRIVDSCTIEHNKDIPYFYSSYTGENQSVVSDRKKIVVLGAGPIRIGQGVEFDYSTVHAIWAIREAGYEAIIINNNPETVSTDFTISDKLYFEPLTEEDVMNVINLEKPEGVIVTLGGQTAINLAAPLKKHGVKLIGTQMEAIDNAEDRKLFEAILRKNGIPQPKAKAVTAIEEGVKAAAEIGYPVLVRPSFVLGGRAMMIVGNEEALRHYLQNAVEVNENSPVLVDRYIEGRECEVDAICDGKDVYIPGIMEHVEKTGIHSGDSISVYPPFTLSQKVKEKIVDYTVKLGLAVGIKGLFNIQFIADSKDDVYIIEVNPRSSRTVPFLSKSTGVPMAKIATLVMLGKSLKEQGIEQVLGTDRNRHYVKAPSFSFAKLKGIESYLSPEMKSTGEAIGYDESLNRAIYKALQASGMKIQKYGTVFATIADADKEKALPLIKRFYNLGFNIEATPGTANFLKENGIRTKVLQKFATGSRDIEKEIMQGHVTYIINTIDVNQHDAHLDGYEIRKIAIEHGITLLTALETVNVLLNVLEEIILSISTIDQEYK